MELQAGHGTVDQNLVVEVEIESLSTGDSPRVSGADPEHVEALVAAQTPLPPIIVHRPTLRVIDGLHRLSAARLRGDDKISVVFFDGDEAEAFVLAVESNTTHGLPLTTAERKLAARRIIASHPQWSDRMIASVAGIAPGTVAAIRRQSRHGAAAETARIGQDGRIRPVNIAEGRRLAGQLIAENPGLSLRQIARAASISPETARDVRNRMLRGEDPLPKPRTRKHAEGGTPRQETTSNLAVPTVSTVLERTQVQHRTAVVERLRADPALRFNETGRTLLRLLTVNTASAQNWEEMIDNVPPHCGGIVARLASECAGMWAEFATRLEQRTVAESA
ncbi:ParB N-terminal domain-containing protein [Streptomyces sp. S.PNR 29]|uniref:ParB/RepB/Spo0J family partition protein n=1 Tax=Streptomyces sp. S.PNR 29 TaxID=2973805 RepID=UPI0025B07D53|nr:ParB N-terminal domain-containing protein [Streptomyces sp. S.PNR 29]MDN0200201.1 ParB N-terminal domain-containing protein [Streptomyces sp. S.PNR 29]